MSKRKILMAAGVVICIAITGCQCKKMSNENVGETEVITHKYETVEGTVK